MQLVIQFYVPVSKYVAESHLVHVESSVHNRQLLIFAVVNISHLLHSFVTVFDQTLSS